jgi:hypothetical protein
MKVWIAYQENDHVYQDREILGVFDTRDKECQCTLKFRRNAIANGERVYWNPDDNEYDDDWECDFGVDGPFEVQ